VENGTRGRFSFFLLPSAVRKTN